MGGMSDAIDITDDAIRQHLLARVDAFQAATGMSLWKISKEAVRDDKFLANVRKGGNFTVKTYQRVIDWLDSQERERAA